MPTAKRIPPAAPPPLLLSRVPRQPPDHAEPAEPPRPHEELGQQDHGARERRDDRPDEDVPVDDVRQLVTDHALELDPVHRLEEPLRDRDRRMLGVAARGERVRRAFGDDVDPRLRDARGDREPLDDVVQARLVLRGDLLRPSRRQDEPVAVPIRRDRHPGRDDECEDQPVDAEATDQPRTDHVADDPQENERADDQQPCAALVRSDLLVHVSAPAI
jgi:hypothetical protein